MRKTLVSFFVLSLLLHIEKIIAREDRLVTGCPLSVESRQLMQDVIADFLLDTLYIAESTGIHPNVVPSKAEIAYSSTLIGSVRGVEGFSDPGVRALTFLPELCRSAAVFESRCRSADSPENFGFWKDRDACVQLTCEANGIYKTEVTWIMKAQANAEHHPFVYSTRRGDQVRYNPNPQSIWRVDATSLKRIIVTGHVFAVLRVTTRSGESIDLTHTANATATTTEEKGLSSIVLHVVFPALSSSKTPVRAQLLLNSHDDAFASGSIAAGNNTLATLRLDPGLPLKFTWDPTCK